MGASISEERAWADSESVLRAEWARSCTITCHRVATEPEDLLLLPLAWQLHK